MKRGYRNLACGLLVAWFAFGPVMALAEDCYRIIHGKGNPVCRKLGRNLNRFCDGPPIRWEMKIHPDFAKDFTFPKWEDLDPVAHIDLVAELVRSRAPVAEYCTGECETKSRELKWQEYRPKLLEHAKAGCIRFSRARLDITHDGVKELVFRLRGENCPMPADGWLSLSNGTPSLMVLDETTGKFDPELMERLHMAYDLILHQGRVNFVYFDRYDDTWSIYDRSIYPVCEYQILEHGENGRSK